MRSEPRGTSAITSVTGAAHPRKTGVIAGQRRFLRESLFNVCA